MAGNKLLFAIIIASGAACLRDVVNMRGRGCAASLDPMVGQGATLAGPVIDLTVKSRAGGSPRLTSTHFLGGRLQDVKP